MKYVRYWLPQSPQNENTNLPFLCVRLLTEFANLQKIRQICRFYWTCKPASGGFAVGLLTRDCAPGLLTNACAFSLLTIDCAPGLLTRDSVLDVARGSALDPCYRLAFLASH